MKSKLVVLALSLVAVAALVLTGCAPEAAAPESEEEAQAPEAEEEQAAPAAPAGEVYKMDFQAWPNGGPYLEQVKMFVQRPDRGNAPRWWRTMSDDQGI